VSFANPLPWWALGFVLAAAAAVSWLAYSRWTLSPVRRGSLVLLRFVILTALVVFLMRPVARSGEADGKEAVVPVLVDTSRSMSIEDAGRGVRRIDRARQILTDQLIPTLASRFTVETLGFGESLAAVTPNQLSAVSRRSDLAEALSMVRDRYRNRVVAGIVLVSDGGDTSGAAERAVDGLPPIFPLGVGAAVPNDDREVLSVTAAEQILDGSRVDLAVSAVAHGQRGSPIELRLLENGRPIDVRRVQPAADGVPIREVFQVTPGKAAPTIYTATIPAASGELVPENNSRSVLVQPPARARRVLLVEGAPGFEHSFLKRAWATDPGLEVDSVVRKGKNEQGADTFYIQAGSGRAETLTGGYPANREALFGYDALVLANVEAHHLTRAQLEATRAFVGQRGGGLLVLGARSFLRQGLGDSVLEEVLPLDLIDRGASGVVPAASAGPAASAVGGATLRGTNRVALTTEGESHPIMQLAPTLEDTRKRWDALPALAATATLGSPRAGASVLAVTIGTGGNTRPLIAVQRYGEGRAMVFTGEASWRWRMLMPATDRAYDTFWKQAVRWLAIAASDPIQITAPHAAVPGDPLVIKVFTRDGAFEPQSNVTVNVHVTSPDGKSQSIVAVPDAASEGPGHYVANVTPGAGGIVKISADARRGATPLGSSSTSVLVGGVDTEMADPRLNEQLLRRLATASGGQILSDAQIETLPAILKGSVPTALMTRRDLWHTGWSFAAILVLLAAEWILRRRWGLR
jgi:uncharacterized membrane protein